MTIIVVTVTPSSSSVARVDQARVERVGSATDERAGHELVDVYLHRAEERAQAAAPPAQRQPSGFLRCGALSTNRGR
jgi:hypothetical protein